MYGVLKVACSMYWVSFSVRELVVPKNIAITYPFTCLLTSFPNYTFTVPY